MRSSFVFPVPLHKFRLALHKLEPSLLFLFWKQQDEPFQVHSLHQNDESFHGWKVHKTQRCQEQRTVFMLQENIKLRDKPAWEGPSRRVLHSRVEMHVLQAARSIWRCCSCCAWHTHTGAVEAHSSSQFLELEEEAAGLAKKIQT